MNDGSAFKALLITKGRKTGLQHAVWLRAVSHAGKIYFSRRNKESDWLKNALSEPSVKVQIENAVHLGKARLVTDSALAEKISQLKYPGEKRAQEARVVLEVEML